MTKPTSTTTGTIIRHGEAPYQHDPNNSLNYFVEVEIEKDKYETLWGVQLKELVESQQLEVGEKVSFHKFKQETGANKWEAARYFEVEKLENSIERDFSQEKLTEPVSEFGQSKVKQSADYTTDDAEYIVPNAIRNRYLSVAVNQHTDSPMVKFYERENPAAVAFEDRGDKGLHTSKSDKDTIKAMLDMAQSKGWESIKLKGSEEFKREAWMEAQMRGIKTKGYEPTDKDKLELQARQAEHTNNQIEATKIGAAHTKEANKTSLDHAKNLTAATAAQAIDADKAQSLAADVVIESVQNEQVVEILDASNIEPSEFGQSMDVDVPHGAATEADVQRHNENLEKMLRESQAADQSTKAIHPSMQQAEEKFKSYFGEEKATEFLSIIDKEIAEIEPDYELAAKNLKYAQANTNVALKRAEEFGVQVDSLDEWLAKRNLESMPESRIQADIDSAVHNYRISSMDSIQHLTLSKNDERTMRSIETNLFKIASLKAQQEMGGATVRDIYDYNNYVYDAAVDAEVQKLNEDYDKGLSEEQDNEQDIDDNLLFEQYLEDLENGEIRSNTSWADYRDDWREAFAEADREAQIAAEQHHDLKQVETEAYVRAEEFQRGRDIDPDLDMNVAGEAERFKTDVVAAPKVAGMTQAKVTQKVEAAFDRKIHGSMAATKRDDFKQDFEENKAKLSENDKVKVEAVRRVLDFLHKDNPKELQTGYEKLTTAMKNSEISKLPDVPQQVVQQNIEIQAPTQSNKDRGR